MTSQYGGEKFSSVLFLLFVVCVFSLLASWLPGVFLLLLLFLNSPINYSDQDFIGISGGEKKSHDHHHHHTHDKEKEKESTSQPQKRSPPWTHFALLAMSYLSAMLLSNYSLRYVDYPTSVLSKSVKPIPGK